MPTYEPGDFVKVEFKDAADPIGEWMWVRVDHCDDEQQLVFGTLDNQPLDDCGGKLRLGSELAVNYDKIREHRSGRLGLARSDFLLLLSCNIENASTKLLRPYDQAREVA